ncbi:hypothetical protein [Ensifer canadensis]
MAAMILEVFGTDRRLIRRCEATGSCLWSAPANNDRISLTAANNFNGSVFPG